MSILDNLLNFKPNDEESTRPERRAKKLSAAGDPEKRQKKQKMAKGSLLNATTFLIITKFFAFVLSLAIVAAVVYMIYLGIDIFIGE